MHAFRSTRVRSLLLAGALSSVSVFTWAALPDSWTPDPTFPDFYQKDPKVLNGECACAPAAAVDSFFWLASKYNLPKMATQGGATWQDVTNTLEGANYMNTVNDGTTYSGSFAAGKTNYIKAADYADKISVETRLGGSGAPPTLDWIKQQVVAGQDVEILVGQVKDGAAGDPAAWMGGHYVSVTGYDQDGNLKIADPWTQAGGNAENLPVGGTANTTLDFDALGKAKDKYTQTYPKVKLGDGLFTDAGTYQIVFAAFAESPVPEIGTWLMFVLGLGSIGAIHLKKGKGS